jgi:hypothetical protein
MYTDHIENPPTYIVHSVVSGKLDFDNIDEAVEKYNEYCED